jgi:tRNA(fMet)-specific endonuclease VapC
VGKVIDSSILVAMERGELHLEAVLREHRDERIAISTVTASEMLHGAYRLKGSKRVATEAFVEALLLALPVLPFDLMSARVHAKLSAELAASGNTIGDRDLMIAATALVANHEIVTRDTRSFPRIPGLRVVHW